MLPKTARLVEIVERRLKQLQDQLGSDALERRLESERMFAQED